MTPYDFDTVIDRSGTDAIVHEELKSAWGRDDLHPMWVADMGFAVCPAITEAMRRRLEHPIFGYTAEPKDYFPAIHDWVWDHHHWDISREWLSFVPGIVKGIGMVCNVFLQPEDKVIVMPPVYHLFYLTPRANHREVVWNPLREQAGGGYVIDFEGLEQVCDEHCKLLILCNPHNPGGICWDEDTLRRLAIFCKTHHLLVVSDEIHCDLTLFGHRHIPFASVSDTAAEISITFQAPSKTFNIAGIVSSYAIIPNPDIRERLYGWMAANEFERGHIFAYVATVAAYRHGEEWRRQLIAYLEDNIRFVEAYCREHIPGVRPMRPESSFLVWLDCRDLGLKHDELIDLFVQRARLALHDGEIFGPGGQGFMRLNIGLPRSYVEQGLSQLAQAVRTLSSGG